MRALSKMQQILDDQRGSLFPWAPVFFGIGIAIYFALRFEPGQSLWTLVGACSLIAAVLAWHAPARRLGVSAVMLALAGFAIAGIRAHSVEEPVLGFRYFGPIEGRIVGIDRSASDALRLTLDQVVMRDMSRGRTPARVRVSLHGEQGFIVPEPGQRVIMTGHLSPPGGPVEPGGFDFQRHAWFQSIGAVGYTRTPVLLIEPFQPSGFGIWVTRVRLQISAAVQQTISGRAGGFAAAITTGDRSGMDAATLEALRASNLAHLLAISGLHMGLLTGFVFAAVRVALSLSPHMVLVLPAKKIAAVMALAAGAVYLALSGGNVATERAFIMVAVMFLALLVDRRAITLRAVAVAALIVLTFRPEALYGPGFQMSFAATTALVAVFGSLRAMPGEKRRWPKWISFIWGVALSSFIAGMATAPIAAAHFNQVPHYGLIANILSVPLMGAIIIPGAVLAALLAPFGQAWVGLWLMKWPILWILSVAETVAGWDGAVSKVIAPGPMVLPVMALGALLIVIWQGRARLLGLPVMLAALVLWTQAERPSMLVAQSGGMIGVMTEEGRALSKPKGEAFASGIWLENDGDSADQPTAFNRARFRQDGRMRWIPVGDGIVLHATGKVASASAVEVCASVDLVVVNVRIKPAQGCMIYDADRLMKTGSLAVEAGENGLKITTARAVGGLRLWSQ